jgi:type IV secretion system protein TrbL
MDTTTVGILNSLLGQYETAAGLMKSTAVSMAKDLFNSLVLVSFGVWCVRRLINRGGDQADSNIHLVKMFIYMNVFYLFITNYDAFFPLILNSLKAAGITLGKSTTNFIVTTNPGQVMNTGASIFSTLLNLALKHVLRVDLIGAFLSVVVSIIVLLCFAGVAIEVILIEVGTRIILTAGIIMLAFAASEWTRDYATRYINACFAMGIKLLFVYLIVGIGGSLTSTWVTTLNTAGLNPQSFLSAYAAVLVASVVYWGLVHKLPDQAVGYLTGGHGISFGMSTSGLAAASAATGMAVKGYALVTTKAAEFATKRAADKLVKETTTAYAKDHFSAQGKIPTNSEIKDFYTKTMGEAKQKAKADQTATKVAGTFDGKVAQKIQELRETEATANKNKKP